MRVWLLLIMVLICSTAWGANRYVRTTGGNWNTASTWASTNGGTDTVAKPSSSDDVFLTSISGATTIDAAATCKTINATGYTNTLTHDAFTLTVAGSATFDAGMTYTPNVSASTIIAFSQNGTLLSGGKLMPTITVASGKTLTIGDDTTFDATKTRQITLTGALNLNGHTLNGNSSINRLLITSATLGTPSTVTPSTAASTFSNTDFRDIAFSSATNVDMSLYTGGIGDCGGNSISGGGTLSFTTADDWYWYNSGAGTYNWSDYSHWYTETAGGGTQMASTTTPLCQDTLYFDGSSIDGATTVNQDLPRIGGLDFTGVSAMNFVISNIAQGCYGSIATVANANWSTGSPVFSMLGRSADTLSSDGADALGRWIINKVTGSLTFNSSNKFTCLFLTSGTLDINDAGGNYSVTGFFDISGSATRRLDMGSDVWNINSVESSQHWTATTTTNLTFNKESASIETIYTGATAHAFKGGNLTYNNYTINTGSGILTVAGSNTFNTFTINGPKTVKFSAGTTQNVNSFVITGTATIASTVASSAFTIEDINGGTNVNDNLNVTDSHGHPDNTFYYGASGTADAYSQANGWAAAPLAGGVPMSGSFQINGNLKINGNAQMGFK